ncbi:acetyl-CoA carboxylase biotin carboxyl carrier protein subunit [Desulfurococcaceae archaeon MEX13E-LK6-19]|nr:acetyl-CoA carboxylase biotin carboxyl carrier protein subunit [Desulfurococcaceae archaeon MEX13E-LK6-19]
MARRYRAEISSGGFIEIEIDGKDREYNVKIFDESGVRIYNVKIINIDDDAKQAVIEINGRRVKIAGLSGGIVINGVPSIVKRVFELIPISYGEKTGVKRVVQREKGLIVSPIDGKITDVKVKPGDKVNPDSVIALMSSMKMITEIKAGIAGVVTEVYVKPGVAIKKGEKIVKIKPIVEEEGKEEKKEKKSRRKKKQ